MTSNTIRRIGNELLVPVSEEMLATLGLGEGDEVVAKAGAHVIELSAREPNVDRQVEFARRGMKKYRNTLAALAK